MLEKNFDIIYNKKYLVIVPTMSKNYMKYLEYSFGNTILFDNTSDENFLVDFINKNNFNQLIFVDFQLEYEHVIKKLNGEHEIKFILTKSLGGFSDDFVYTIFKEIINLYNKKIVKSIGFLDIGLYKVFKNRNINCFFLCLDKEYKILEKNNISKFKIGILNQEENPKHSFYNELSALKFKNYTSKVLNPSKRTKEFLDLFGINYEGCLNEEEVMHNSLLNLYINFTDNNNLVFFESMDVGVPCILGNNSILSDNKFLKSMLVVESDDSIDEISSKIEIVKKNRSKILEEYNKFRKKYSEKSKKLIKEFLGCEKETIVGNNDDMLLSIVVPVYNTEMYLSNCLKSIIKALPKNIQNKTEILIINDGSTDNSEEIILKFKNKYPELINYIKQKNHGLGNVRNVGLNIAKGKYIASIDSDDTVNPNFFRDSFDGLYKDVDIVMCDWLSVTNDSKFETNAIEWIFNDTNRYEGLLYTTIMPSSCNKIIKKSLYNNLKIKFVEDKYEDLSTNPFIMLEAKTIKYINKPYYEYYIRSNSIMRSSAGYSMINVIKEVDNRLNKYIEYVNIDIEKFKFYTYSWRIEEFIFNQLYDVEEDKLKDFVSNIYSNLFEVISNILNNSFYIKMLENISLEKSNFIKKRNEAFLNKDLLKFIAKSREKNNFFKISAPLVYFGEVKK